MDKELLSIGETAKMLGVSIDTLRRWDKNGKLSSFRPVPTNNRYYRRKSIEMFLEDLAALGCQWAMSELAVLPPKDYYCETSDVFKVRLERLSGELMRAKDLINIFPLLIAVAGEIGNNSFDHNLGDWSDIKGVFFGYDLVSRKI